MVSYPLSQNSYNKLSKLINDTFSLSPVINILSLSKSTTFTHHHEHQHTPPHLPPTFKVWKGKFIIIFYYLITTSILPSPIYPNTLSQNRIEEDTAQSTGISLSFAFKLGATWAPTHPITCKLVHQHQLTTLINALPTCISKRKSILSSPPFSIALIKFGQISILHSAPLVV